MSTVGDTFPGHRRRRCGWVGQGICPVTKFGDIDGIYIYVYIGLSRLLELRKPEYDWGVGWGGVGWDVNVHVNLRQQLMLRTRCELAAAVDATHTRGGGGGVGWDVNVHVNLRQQLMLRTRGVGGVGWDVNVHVNLRQQLMLRTRTPGRHRERSSKLCETCSCCEETEKTGLTCFWWWWYWWWWCWWWWWGWWWWTWPKWNLLIPRRNFVTEWTSFTNLIQVYAVPEAWTRLYIHIYMNKWGHDPWKLHIWIMGYGNIWIMHMYVYI